VESTNRGNEARALLQTQQEGCLARLRFCLPNRRPAVLGGERQGAAVGSAGHAFPDCSYISLVHVFAGDARRRPLCAFSPSSYRKFIGFVIIVKLSLSERTLYATCILNGIAAGFWLGFVCFWTCTYVKARQARNRLRGSRFFYISALLYQIIAFANFATYSLTVFVTSPAAQQIASLCATMYIPLAYFVGMTCSAGFGTLYMRVPGKQLWLSIATLAVGLAALFLWTNRLTLPAMVICSSILLVQVLTSAYTWWLLQYLQRHYKALGYSALSVNLHQSLRRFRYLVPFITLSFTFIACEVIYECIISLDREKLLGLRMGFVVTTTVGNGCVLLLMRPRHALADTPEMYQILNSPNLR